jgi:hypothetical protein
MNAAINQTNLRLGNRLIQFSGMVLIISSLVKFLHPARAVAYMAFLGYSDEKLFLIAAMEVVIALLFLRSSTRAAGLLLLSSYFGGAIAAHIAYHPITSNAPIIVFDALHPYTGSLPPVLVLVSAWMGVWLRHPEFFGRTGSRPTENPLRVAKTA